MSYEVRQGERMINYINHSDGVTKLAELLINERLIPVFGAGFSKGSPSLQGKVPDGNECNELMKKLIRKYVTCINETILETYDFNDTAKRLKKSVPRYISENTYVSFFKDNFTDVHLSPTKTNFLSLPWPFIFTINIDDGIENTRMFNTILPYHNARKDNTSTMHSLFKLHGDANYEILYKSEKNIIFDSDQYTQSLNEPENQTMRDVFSNAYKEYNLLFVGCSLKNEPDIKYIYNSISKERLKTMGIVLRTHELSEVEEDDIEDYGITDVIIVNDYDLFYVDLYNTVREKQIKEKTNHYPFMNPYVKNITDKDLKYFSGYRCFSEKENTFFKSDLIINRDYLEELEKSLEKYYVIFIEGRRFSGKTSLLCTFCENEKKRNIFFFPSTTQERVDIVTNIINSNTYSLLIFDSNSLSSECYYMIRDMFDVLHKNDIRIIVAINQSDNYLSERIEADYIKINNTFSNEELRLLEPKTNLHVLAKRRPTNSNLDYINIIKNEQGIPLYFTLNLPNKYTKNEQILLLLLGVKDKIYSRDITSLKINYSEIQSFLSRTSILCEWVHTAKGEGGTYSAYKLVHNSKIIILEEIRKLNHDDIIKSIITIISTLRNGDTNQKRIYREVMQFDTLNQLFGRKKGAGKLISKVYESLENLLSDDLHFWLQRSKSIYRLVPNKYQELKKSYSYAKKVYMDSENDTLTTKAALSVSLICSLLYKLEEDFSNRISLLEEAITLGERAIFSEYYKQEKRLKNDLNSESKRNNYADLIKETCLSYISLGNKNTYIEKKAYDILKKINLKNDFRY